MHRISRVCGSEAPDGIRPAGKGYRTEARFFIFDQVPVLLAGIRIQVWKRPRTRKYPASRARWRRGQGTERLPPEPGRARACSRGGFTLIEVLTVLAVVGVLAALLLPALSSARQRAYSVTCLNNLRQWGLATQLYAADHEDFLPPDGAPNPTDSTTNLGWYIQLPRVLGLPRYHDMPWRTNPAVEPGRSVWICPANPRRSNGRNLFHYCLNEHVNGTGDEDRPVRLGSLPEPSRTVWLFDTKNLPAVGFWNFVHTNLHQGGAQFSFLDGHARRLPRRAYWDFEANQPRREGPDLRWIP